ncbi:MAG: four helix bundle protein [Eubacteriales bacterium]
MADNNVIQEKSFGFAVRIVKLFKYLCDEKNEYTLSKQLMRSGTSIGANVSEALRGVSRRDFNNKMAISLKEANETEYWIKLLYATDYLTEVQYNSIYTDCIEIIKILTAIVKNTSEKLNTK